MDSCLLLRSIRSLPRILGRPILGSHPTRNFPTHSFSRPSCLLLAFNPPGVIHLNSYTASEQDYINCLSHSLPFKVYVSKVISDNSAYLCTVAYGSNPIKFDYDRDFYSLIAHICATYKSTYPELFI